MHCRRASSERIVLGGLALWGAAAVAYPSDARCDPDPRMACIKESEEAQHLRHEGQLRRASQDFAECARIECPPLVRRDCSRWLAEVLGEVPSVVLGVHDADGRDLVDVQVWIDGNRVVEHLDGKPILLDPGPHRLRFEAAGASPVEQQLVVREAEKNRLVVITVGEPSATPSASSPSRAAPGDSAPARSGRRIPILTWVLGSLAVVSGGAALALDLSALSQASCSPRCSASAKSAITDQVLTVYGLTGVAALSAGAAAALFFSASPARRASPATFVRVGPLPGGVAAAFGGRFD